jgi:hypothetical protein
MRAIKLIRNSLKQFHLKYQTRISMAIELFLVVLFAFLAWQNENRFFAIFLIFFFFISSYLKKQRYFTLIIVPILVFFLFNTLTLDALLILKNLDLPSIQHPKAELSNFFTPNSGQGVLPAKVLTMISILKENNIESYKISDKFSNDIVIYQRIVEGAWPIKLENTSSYTLISTEELNLYNGCKTIDEKEDVILVDCH